ncbi:M15 family metallopeptidase [Cellulomonas palmilytica]|uniref:M15 family metallopeptidase n=1 Tax=Cellulomonas palmilytica TaxID=2608402 RepID=UPI001F318A89|nr:M15 family metallopeptidase [Cellulomonas palmilytica]UJP40761.1 M15 family metallopeptidase [Cellulomonas palmilytica]
MTTSTGPQWPTTPAAEHGTPPEPRTARSGHAAWGEVVPGPLAASVAQEGARRRRRRGTVLVVVLAVVTWFGVRWAEEAFAGSQGDPSTAPGVVVGAAGDDEAGGAGDAPAPPPTSDDDDPADEPDTGTPDTGTPDDTAIQAVVDELTAVGIDEDLARRYARADAAAAREGVAMHITSGRRTAAEQRALFDDAVARYGSVHEAQRWVLPADRSAHVAGTAVDVGGTEAALWLGEHGQEFGLCRVYANEIWHFEAMPDGADRCPDLLPDSSSGW